jgi:hypothetical protein
LSAATPPRRGFFSAENETAAASNISRRRLTRAEGSAENWC